MCKHTHTEIAKESEELLTGSTYTKGGIKKWMLV
jgi:hypothetical protein